MRSPASLLLLTCLLLVGCASLPQPEATPPSSQGLLPLIPMRDFFRNPERTAFQLSPDGAHVAFLMPWQSRLNVHVQAVGSDAITRVTAATERDIEVFAWANNGRIIYFQDTAGDENFRAYAADIDGGNPQDLTPFDNVKVDLVDPLEDDDEHILITMNQRDERLFDVYRINVSTGEMEMVAENPGNVLSWITDNAGALRAAVASDGVNSSLLFRETEADEWQTAVTTNFKDMIEPQFFDFDNRYLYVASNIGRDTEAISTYDPRTNQHLELVFEHPEVDVNEVLRSKQRKLITGVAYLTDRLEYHFFDDQRRALQETLEARLAGYEVTVTSSSRDETKVLVVASSDRTQGAYYFYDLTTGELEKLVDVSPWLDEDAMAEMRPIQYTSRDGLTIHGYLTLPVGVEARNLPVVVLPHGGPWIRDAWGFSPEVQFLANRGYAVLQMNFRGSLGYGKSFWMKGFKQWGRTMQDDITDGVRWLVDQGIADPGRIGIYGGSYGGYAALAGLTFTPDLYACGVSYVGISNIFTLLETLPPYWEIGRQMFYEMMGDPVADADLLRAVSPLFHADQIQAPLLVIQGANDPRVKKAESDQIVEALRARGVDVPYLVKDNEGHGFHNEENRFDAYRAIEQFLGKHLGGRVEEQPAD